MPNTDVSNSQQNSENAEKTALQKSMENAALSATKYFAQMMNATQTKIKNIRLEEIEQFEEKGQSFWRVTISFIDGSSDNPMQIFYGDNQDKRIYKIITVTDGDFVATAIKDRL